MSPEQFWMTWSVQAVAAFLTLCAVIVALFGDRLRAILFPPALRIRLRDAKPEKTDAMLQDPNNPTKPVMVTKALWYHVRVENRRRTSQATHVQVLLLRVEEPNASGIYSATWVGEIPLKWRHMQMNPVAGRTIGPTEDADLVSVFKNGYLQIHTLIVTLPPDKLIRTGKCNMRLVLQARSLEVDSNTISVEVAWDGTWADDSEEMARRLVVREV